MFIELDSVVKRRELQTKLNEVEKELRQKKELFVVGPDLKPRYVMIDIEAYKTIIGIKE